MGRKEDRDLDILGGCSRIASTEAIYDELPRFERRSILDHPIQVADLKIPVDILKSYTYIVNRFSIIGKTDILALCLADKVEWR